MYAFTSPLPVSGLSSSTPRASSTSSRRPSIILPTSLKSSPSPSPSPSPSFQLPFQLTLGTPLRSASLALTIVATSLTLLSPLVGSQAALAGGGAVRLPPIIRSDRQRCLPSSSAIGQANAARDKVLDLRECDLRKLDLTSYDMSGALMADADFQGAVLVEAQLSKSYAAHASFRDVDFTNAVADRVVFDGSDLTNAVFANAVLSDATFAGAVLENVDFTDSYVGDFTQRNICRNTSTKGTNPVTGVDTRESLGCR